jgi:hypothetical protein
MEPMEPAALLMDTHFGFEDFSRKGLKAWKRTRGPRALILKVEDTSSGSTVSSGLTGGLTPAFAMAMSM